MLEHHLAIRVYRKADIEEAIGEGFVARLGLGHDEHLPLAGEVGSGKIVVAGSINSAERIAAIRAAGADAFTIGTAAIDASYAPGAGPLEAQLSAVLADCGAVA